LAESNRRDFFRRAASEAVRGAREVIPLVDPLAALVEGQPAGAAGAPAPPPAAAEPDVGRTEPATPTSRAASVEEMLEIAAELGLGARAEDLRRLATPSARLCPDPEADGPSFAGGEPTLPGGVDVPELDDRPAEFVALLDLPTGGRLWVFRSDPDAEASDAGADGSDPADDDGTATPKAAAVLEPAGDPGAAEPIPVPLDATPLLASLELTLPRPWSPAVEALGLSRVEQDSWQELRKRLAAAQGVPLGESAPPHAAVHRLGGYPDERRGDMPLICELGLLGVDLEGRPPATHPLAAAIEDEIGDWRLLAQLGADDDVGWSWGPQHQRLYVWAQVEDPASSEYASVQVIVQ
jgi:hypothetical protein